MAWLPVEFGDGTIELDVASDLAPTPRATCRRQTRIENMHAMTLPPLENDGRDPASPPAMPFWQMRKAPDGSSMIAQQTLRDFLQRSVSSETAAIWMRQFPGEVKAVWFNILPVGWIGDWHPSPALQWVVPLSWRWFIETQDGARVEMGAGEIHWGADLAGDAEASMKGHRSGQAGDVPCVQLMVQFAHTSDLAVALGES